MATSFEFIVFGEAASKGSSKGFVIQRPGQKPHVVITSTNRNLKAWEGLVRARANEARTQAGHSQPLAGPVALSIDFLFQRPKRLLTRSSSAVFHPHISAPDLSKLVRGLEDALSGILFLDDRQVARIEATKAYAPPGEGSSCRVMVCEHYPAQLQFGERPTAAAYTQTEIQPAAPQRRKGQAAVAEVGV